MPRPKDDDLDFKIFVDPSCLSDPMDDETTTATPPTQPSAGAAAPETADIPVAADPIDEIPHYDASDAPDAPENTDKHDDASDEAQIPEPVEAIPEEHTAQEVDGEAPKETPDVEVATAEVDSSALNTEEEAPELGGPEPDTPEVDAKEQTAQHNEAEPDAAEVGVPEADGVEVETAEADTIELDAPEPEAPEVETEAVEAAEVDATDFAAPEAEAAEEHDTADLDDQAPVDDNAIIEGPTHDDHIDDAEEQRYTAVEDEPVLELEQDVVEEHDVEHDSSATHNAEGDADGPALVEEQSQDVREDSFAGEEEETPKALRHRQSDASDHEGLRPAAPISGDRKTSLRTEALIQAAARAVVAKLEKRNSNRDSISQVDEEVDTSILSTNSQDHHDIEDSAISYQESPSHSRRESTDSQLRHNVAPRSASGDEGGDSSSHHDGDDDVFSNRSARSSLGSYDGQHSDGSSKHHTEADQQDDNRSFVSQGRSPRVSGVSLISGLSQYDKEDFVPTSRETRLPFRTPSDIRAMQMTSPSPSVFNGASPRSGKRHSVGSVPRPTYFQSPTASAQYSPKGRSTPTRLKPRKTAPLVLLHVTLLPLRWMWGDVLDGLDPVNGKALDENKEVYEASEQLKTLRDAWRELQDCVGETVLDRGVLLPHPQNDFEMLEERLLEALELPLRRRARILECGHYLGPSNMTDDEDDESEDGYTSDSTRTREAQKHWCTTCKHEIKYEALGPGKVFRVKVFASNGLMKAGAWEACWKDMERVDVELEPIVEPAMQAELERLAEIQMRLEDERQQEAEAAEEELRRQQEAEASQAQEEAQEEEAVADQTLPIQEQEPSWVEPARPVSQAQSREMAMSSPAPASMQVAIHASPAQPPYSSGVRTESPAFMGAGHASRSMGPEAMDTSDARMRSDEERMREIYGEAPTPTPQPFSEMGSSVLVQHESARARHPDSYIPPPLQRSPSEEAYERRQQRDARLVDLENASFSDLFLEAFKVLLRDPKNVAIIVLCVFLGCVMIRPAPQPPVFPNDQLAYRQEPKPEVVLSAPVEKVEQLVHSQVDASLASQLNVGQDTTPLVDIVSSIVTQISSVAPTSEAVLESSLPLAVSPSEERTSPLSDIAEEVLEAAPESISADNSLDASSEIDTPAAALEDTADIDVIAEAVSEPTPEEDDDVRAATTDVPLEMPVELESFAIPVEDDTTTMLGDAPEDLASDIEELADIVNEAQEIPTVAPEPVVTDEERTSDTDEAPTAEENLVEETPAPTEAMDAEPVMESAAPVDAEPVPHTETPVDSEEAPLDADIPLVIGDEAFIDSTAATTDPESTPTEENSAETTHPCESYVQSKMAASAEASTTQHVAFPITQRTTIRVYETITETVRVSVTATETMSIVETAVPQTVEETVYETETLRVTVSIPDDGMRRPNRDEL